MKNYISLGILLIAVVLCGFGAYAFASKPEVASVQSLTTNASRLTHEEFMAEAEKLSELNQSGSPKDAFNYLQENILTNPALARDCHPLLHHLGHEAYKKYSSFSEGIKYQDELCNSGYTHGLIEASFTHTRDIQKALKETCSGQNLSKYQTWQCNHGTGHGIMYYTGKDVSRSIALCKDLIAKEATDSCVNGVFMERFIVIDHSGKQTSNLPTGLDVCATQPSEVKNDCYTYAPSAFLSLHPNAYQDALEFCSDASRYETTCVRGVGAQTMKENITEPSIALAVCDKAKRSLRDECIAGATSLNIFHSGSTKPAAELCETIFKKYKDSCQNEVQIQQQFLGI